MASSRNIHLRSGRRVYCLGWRIRITCLTLKALLSLQKALPFYFASETITHTHASRLSLNSLKFFMFCSNSFALKFVSPPRSQPPNISFALLNKRWRGVERGSDSGAECTVNLKCLLRGSKQEEIGFLGTLMVNGFQPSEEMAHFDSVCIFKYNCLRQNLCKGE